MLFLSFTVKRNPKEQGAASSLKIPLQLASRCAALQSNSVQGQSGTTLLWLPLKQDEEGCWSRACPGQTTSHSYAQQKRNLELAGPSAAQAVLFFKASDFSLPNDEVACFGQIQLLTLSSLLPPSVSFSSSSSWCWFH